MKNTVLVVLLFIGCNSYGQINYLFNRVYQPDTSIPVFTAVKPVESGYLALSGISFYGTYSGVYLTKLDLNGNVKWCKPVTEPEEDYQAAFFGNCLVDTYDDNYVVASEKGTAIETADWVLTKITPEGDTLWQKKYDHVGRDGFAQVIATTDWGYMLAGISQYFYPNGDFDEGYMYLVKTDYKGDTLWTHAYPDEEGATLLYAEQTQDNGYILSGYRYSTASLYDMIVIKVGEFGNEEWRKTFGTDQSDGGCMAYQLPNGNYALTGVIADVQYPRYDLFYALLKPNGDTLLTQTHHKPQSIQNFTPSFTYVEEDKIYLITISFGFTTEQVEFVVLSFNGDILYQTPINSGIGDDDYIRDIEPTPDGGFVLAGFNYQSPQSAWLVKVDSLGNTCSFMNCDSTIYTGYPIGLTHIANNNYWSVTPNPSSEQINISPPSGGWGVNSATFVLYDLLGRAVRQVGLGSGTVHVSVLGLPAGTYFYQIINPQKQILQHDKLIVLH